MIVDWNGLIDLKLRNAVFGLRINISGDSTLCFSGMVLLRIN